MADCIYLRPTDLETVRVEVFQQKSLIAGRGFEKWNEMKIRICSGDTEGDLLEDAKFLMPGGLVSGREVRLRRRSGSSWKVEPAEKPADPKSLYRLMESGRGGGRDVSLSIILFTLRQSALIIVRVTVTVEEGKKWVERESKKMIDIGSTTAIGFIEDLEDLSRDHWLEIRGPKSKNGRVQYRRLEASAPLGPGHYRINL